MFSYGNMVFEFDDPSVPDGLKVISNERMKDELVDICTMRTAQVFAIKYLLF